MNEITTPLTVGQLMTPDPIVLADSAPAEAAVRMLEEHEISGLPIVDPEGLLVGVVSEADIVRARATPSVWDRWPDLRVRDVMHAPVLTADQSMTIEEAAQTMDKAHVHRLIVVAEDQATPIGIVTSSDIVRALAHRPTDG